MKTERFFVRPKADLKALEDAIIDWIDALRAERGLPPLAKDEGADRSPVGDDVAEREVRDGLNRSRPKG